MKDRIVDANFPRTLDQRVYHLGLRAGEVANRVITLGTPSRAHGIASYLDAAPTPFTLTSERGFTTITGRYKGVPVSIVSIGMGHPNADFFVREVRECLNGDMVVVRLGSCGGLIDVPVGSVVVPKGSIAVSRNYDFDFVRGEQGERPYRTSKPVFADSTVHDAVVDALKRTRPEGVNTLIVENTLNASADSFYSSQGRQTSFPDHNADLIDRLMSEHKDLATFEMETFHILHLAACWRPEPTPAPVALQPAAPPLDRVATTPSIYPGAHAPSTQTEIPNVSGLAAQPRIRAAAAQMVFASRTSQDFITPEDVASIEAWAGRAVLEALAGLEIASDRLHEEAGSVWEIKESDAAQTVPR
ncbi:purine and uridine phosphorylase [Trametes gibbosa]|nr:purine and uridine phosphorylase [Trametes gibbosa]